MSELAGRYAAVIGIDAYANGLATLRNAVADARAVAGALATDHGYRDPILLLDRQATGREIVRLLKETLPATVADDSGLVLYFAGHGVALDGDGGPQGYLIPQDADADRPETWLRMAWLRQALTELPCRHLLVVLDCCFAGSFRWAATRKTLLPGGRGLYDSQYARFLRGKAWQVLTSASHQEEAQDVMVRVPGHRDTRGPETDENHSPFAAAFLDGLRGTADRAAPGQKGDGVITATELYLHLFDRLVPAGEPTRQTPGLWPLRPDNTGEFIFLNPQQEKMTRPDPQLDDANNPWRGLTAYEEANAELFFGRERVVEELLGLIGGSSHPPLLAVIGASGTGKSSVVKAGLLPRLRDWKVVSAPRFRGDPRESLAEAERQLAEAPDSHRRLVFFDQFEELYSQHFDAAAQDDFLNDLRNLAERRRIGVLLTLRSDFEPRLRASALGDLLDPGRYSIPAPTSEEFRQIIEKPAAAKALYFEPPELVSGLVDEVMAMPGALPLLSFALAEMYCEARRRRQVTGDLDRALTRQDCDNVGGVVGAFHRCASELLEEAYERGSLQTVRRVALRMVSLDGGRIARRRVSLRELRFADPRTQEVVDRVRRKLTAARLVVADEEYLEPAHDTLVLAWPKLLEWLSRYGSHLELQRQVWRASLDWDRAGREPGLLWNEDPRLPQALDLARRDELNRLEGEFVAASRRRKRMRRNIVAGIAAVSVANVVALAAFLVRRRGRRRRDRASSPASRLRSPGKHDDPRERR